MARFPVFPLFLSLILVLEQVAAGPYLNPSGARAGCRRPSPSASWGQCQLRGGSWGFCQSCGAHWDPRPSHEDEEELENYSDQMARLLFYPRKRSCVKRGSSCDNRPSDCCMNSSCRCNLWGTNCRCQRVGLFQKWG